MSFRSILILKGASVGSCFHWVCEFVGGDQPHRVSFLCSVGPAFSKVTSLRASRLRELLEPDWLPGSRA